MTDQEYIKYFLKNAYEIRREMDRVSLIELASRMGVSNPQGDLNFQRAINQCYELGFIKGISPMDIRILVKGIFYIEDLNRQDDEDEDGKKDKEEMGFKIDTK